MWVSTSAAVASAWQLSASCRSRSCASAAASEARAALHSASHPAAAASCSCSCPSCDMPRNPRVFSVPSVLLQSCKSDVVMSISSSLQAFVGINAAGCGHHLHLANDFLLISNDPLVLRSKLRLQGLVLSRQLVPAEIFGKFRSKFLRTWRYNCEDCALSALSSWRGTDVVMPWRPCHDDSRHAVQVQQPPHRCCVRLCTSGLMVSRLRRRASSAAASFADSSALSAFAASSRAPTSSALACSCKQYF